MFIKKLLSKREQRKVLEAIEMVKIGVLERLSCSYEHVYERQIANSLAAAVVKELFCEEPMEPYAKQFLETNRQLVERELANMKYDEQICKIITQAIRFKTTLLPYRSHDSTNMDSHVEKMTQLGIFIPDEPQLVLKDFCHTAVEFRKEVQ